MNPGVARDRHIEQYRPRCKTDIQRQRFDELLEAGVQPWPLTHKGKSVVDAFHRYLVSFDPSHITEALYHFSIQGAGGLNEIAHYNLHGFRGVYDHPFKWLQLYARELQRHPITDSSYLGTDGITYQEVREAIAQLLELNPNLVADAEDNLQNTRRAHDLAAARELAERHGFTLTPKETSE